MLVTVALPAFGQDKASEETSAGYLVDQSTLPDAITLKGARPKADPSEIQPAATSLPADLQPLQAPPSLALPDQTDQVSIHELRPITLEMPSSWLKSTAPS